MHRLLLLKSKCSKVAEQNKFTGARKDAIAKAIFSRNFVTPILKNKLGDSAGVFGAAMLGDHI